MLNIGYPKRLLPLRGGKRLNPPIESLSVSLNQGLPKNHEKLKKGFALISLT